MVYKLCSNQRFAVLLILALSGCRAQDPNLLAPNLTAILREPEAYQRKFVVDYMNAPTCHVDGYPRTSDNCDDFRFLMNNTTWALPMVEHQIKEWLKEPEANKEKIRIVTTTILHASTIEVLEFTARVFADTPDSRKWVERAIGQRYGWSDPNYITKFYYALESPNPLIREVAEEVVPKWLTLQTEGTLAIWGEALLERYHHEPTALELLKDPLVGIGSVHGDLNPEVLRQKLAFHAKLAYERKKAVGNKKTQ